jgi:cyclic beta-1,2-glucan synthetase
MATTTTTTTTTTATTTTTFVEMQDRRRQTPAEDVQRYKVEPYVIAADVYGAAPHVGRGGWTWYTGSAGWAWRVAVESVLGLRVENGNTLVLKPCVPDEWPFYQIDYRHPGSKALLVIEVRNPDASTECVTAVKMDGTAFPVTNGEARVPIPKTDGTFNVRVILGARAG